MSTKASEFLNKISGRLTLGKVIRAIRLGDEIKQGEFAKTLGVTQSYLSDLERDCKEVSPRKAAEMAEILGQSEKQFIRLAIQDLLFRNGFHYEIDIHETA